MSDESIKALQGYSVFQEFQQHILNEINNLDTVSGLETMPNELAGEEAKVRSKTKDTVLAIFAPFLTIVEKRELTDEEVNEAKEKYAL